ncbi:hypothetical protein F2P81_005865 [Scophthalmus maximus]|uniref:Uncharacterized protein n=1 Tax=Scophthalmus maximus TaxID=52904 RepID=A0A6A4T8F4_SCOMX|nr:hypothetical protein F2P81_005865 [Scophthalmus maximus]
MNRQRTVVRFYDRAIIIIIIIIIITLISIAILIGATLSVHRWLGEELPVDIKFPVSFSLLDPRRIQRANPAQRRICVECRSFVNVVQPMQRS